MGLHHEIQRALAACEHGIEDFRDYQPTAVDFVLDNPFCALFVDVGLGKTVSSLTVILTLLLREEISHVLVIAPRRVCLETWPEEIRKWRHTVGLSFTHVREDEVVRFVNDSGRAEREAIRQEVIDELTLWNITNPVELKAEMKVMMDWPEHKERIHKARVRASRIAVRQHFKRNPAAIHIVNREQVEFLVEAWGRDWPYDFVVVDESSSLKDHRTDRFRALKKVRPFMKRMLQLTATPAAETYMHLFAQIFLLDEGKRFGRGIEKFRQKYFVQNAYTYKWTLRPGAEEEITAKIADICLVMKAEDYLDLEEPLPIRHPIKLSPEQMRLYKQMEKDYIVELPGGIEVEAETAAALSQKLLQMASGVLYETVTEEVNGRFKKRRIVHHIHDHKIDALQVLVEELRGENILVAYWHESSLARLKKAFPQAVVMDPDGACIKKWNKRQIQMLLVHPQSAGHGLNIQLGGRRIVFFDIPWSLELFLQLVGRLAGARQLARPEGERLVMLHYLIAEGTVDEEVVEALIEKRDAQEILFALLKKMRKKLLQRLLTVSNNDEL